MKRAFAMLLSALTIGCVRESDTRDTVVVQTPAGTPARRTPAPPPPADTGRDTVRTSTVQITLSEWVVSMAPDTVRPGRVTFRIRNGGQRVHGFEVEGGGREWKVATIPVGGTSTIVADLGAGTYQVYCPVVDDRGDHRQLGMRATLIVR